MIITVKRMNGMAFISVVHFEMCSFEFFAAEGFMGKITFI